MTKRIITGTVIALLLASVCTYAQEKVERRPPTKLEESLSKKGTLIVKEVRKAGTLAGLYSTMITVKALTIYRPGLPGEKTRGLNIEVKKLGRHERSNTSFLDMDEVGSLSKAISYMISQVKKWKGSSREYTEIIFSTRGDFQVGFYQKGTEVQAFVQSGRIGTVNCWFPVSDFPALKGIIDKGRTLLRQ